MYIHTGEACIARYFKLKKKTNQSAAYIGVVEIAASNVVDNAFYDLCSALKY